MDEDIPVIDVLATRFCSLNAKPRNADRIRRLLWDAYESAGRGELLTSELLIAQADQELTVAEREVGIGPRHVAVVATDVARVPDGVRRLRPMETDGD